MKIVFTGPCDLFTRKEFEELLDDYEIIVQRAVSGLTDLLVTNNLNSGTSKLRKARSLNKSGKGDIKIMLYKEFLYEYIPEYLI